MRIMITAPSLDENRNVSGISTIVRQIIDHGRSVYVHFVAGREDGETADVRWLLKQAILPVSFYNAIRRERPDIIHLNTAFADLSIWRDAVLSRVAKAAGKRLVVAIHGGKFLMNDFTSRGLAAVTAGMLRRADIVVVFSDAEQNQLLKRWPDLNIRVLANAIPFDEVPDVSRNNAVPVLIFLGRMHESKGLHETIEAAGELKAKGLSFVFRAYGEGPLREFFVNGMTAAIGDDFEYGGVIAGREKWDKLAAADIFVLPSRYEGLPMAMLEAMAVGCVVVASDIAAVTAVVKNGENGYIVEPQNAPQLVEVLSGLLDDRESWSRIQDAARATIKDHFGIEEYIETLEDIYSQAAG